MNNLTREIKNSDGTIDAVIISSEDKYSINLNKKYKLANCYTFKDSFGDKFKNSIFGTDIGINSRGFASVALMSFILVVISFVVLYFLFRV